MVKYIATALLGVISCWCGPITTLYNTGSAPLGEADPNWTVNGQTAYVTAAGFPSHINSWTAAWISPQPDYTADQTDADGVFIYATHFDLSGYDLNTVSIEINSAVDNMITEIRLNGINFYSPPFLNGFVLEPPYTLTSGFTSGLNSLEFVTYNLHLETHNPSGLWAAFGSSGDLLAPPSAPPPGSPADAPEPVTASLIGIGLVVGAVVRRRRL